MPDVFLGLGSNIEPEVQVPVALAELEANFGPLKISSIYESEAVGFLGPPFHNLVVGFASARPVEDIAGILAAIEDRQGRVREGAQAFAIAIDIDLLLYGDLILQDGRLQLPRPDILSRAFVLEPLAEIAPDQRHPETGETYSELWTRFDKTGLVQTRLAQAGICRADSQPERGRTPP